MNKEAEVSEETVSEEVETEETTDENVTDINSKLEENKMKEEIEALNDKYQRLQAEYTNYRRRTAEEKKTVGLFANEKIVTELIPVIDNMERAMDSAQDKEDPMYKGVELVYKQLLDALAKFGVEEIKAEGCEFDPSFHMAVMQEEVEGVEAGKVVMVLQKGYKLGTKVIRASMVKVSC